MIRRGGSNERAASPGSTAARSNPHGNALWHLNARPSQRSGVTVAPELERAQRELR
jgi:hypothetical protein